MRASSSKKMNSFQIGESGAHSDMGHIRTLPLSPFLIIILS